PAETIRMLNEVFDCQVAAIERHGGDVLKFMGDGLLAIFPIDERHPPPATCDAALSATGEAFTALERCNAGRGATGAAPLSFGVSLHVGEVAYGNIGGAARLDFTCIGAAVNLAARIEGLTAQLRKRLLLSEEFARATTVETRSLGAFGLKGVAQPATV